MSVQLAKVSCVRNLSSQDSHKQLHGLARLFLTVRFCQVSARCGFSLGLSRSMVGRAIYTRRCHTASGALIPVPLESLIGAYIVVRPKAPSCSRRIPASNSCDRSYVRLYSFMVPAFVFLGRARVFICRFLSRFHAIAAARDLS